MKKSSKILLYGSLFSTLYITTCVFIYKDSLIDKRESINNRVKNDNNILVENRAIEQNQKDNTNSIKKTLPIKVTPTPTLQYKYSKELNGEQDNIKPIKEPEKIEPKEVTNSNIEDLKLQNIQDKISKLIKTHRITFYRGSRQITLSAKKTLKQIAKLIKNLPDIRVVVKGYTDASGSATLNKKLSLRRAKVVKRYLTHLGIEANRIEAVGFGEENLIDTKNPNNPINRRIEIELRRY
jgi:outer membrane protein OmpA-like peptidoglycan-associated protein